MALLPGPAARADEAVTITVLPMRTAQERPFDPWKPPGAKADPNRQSDLPGPPADEAGKPLITPGESACTVYDLRTPDATFRFRGDKQRRIRITSLSVTISARTVIHLPVNATARLIEHERGHDALARYAYGRIAGPELEKALRGFVGSTFVPTPGKDAKQAAEQALSKRLTSAGIAIKARIDELGDVFDQLTEHGRSQRVSTKTAVETAKDWFEKSPPDGKPPPNPVPVPQILP